MSKRLFKTKIAKLYISRGASSSRLPPSAALVPNTATNPRLLPVSTTLAGFSRLSSAGSFKYFFSSKPNKTRGNKVEEYLVA